MSSPKSSSSSIIRTFLFIVKSLLKMTKNLTKNYLGKNAAPAR
jgi:hypothetical protein